MNIFIYFIIAVLFGVLIFWTWNNTKDFEENSKRIIFYKTDYPIFKPANSAYFE